MSTSTKTTKKTSPRSRVAAGSPDRRVEVKEKAALAALRSTQSRRLTAHLSPGLQAAFKKALEARRRACEDWYAAIDAEAKARVQMQRTDAALTEAIDALMSGDP